MKYLMCEKQSIKDSLFNGMPERARAFDFFPFTIPYNRSRFSARGLGFLLSKNGSNLFYPFPNRRQGSSKKLQALCSLTTCDPMGFYNSGEGSSFRKIVAGRIEAATKNASGLMITRKLPDYALNLSGRKRLRSL